MFLLAAAQCLAANEPRTDNAARPTLFDTEQAPGTAGHPQANAAADPSLATVSDAGTSTKPAPQRGFFTRLGHAYLDDWTVDSNGSPNSPESPRRGTPRPLNSPPFPSADWSIGGTVPIGAPDYNSYMLMQAINENKSQ